MSRKERVNPNHHHCNYILNLYFRSRLFIARSRPKKIKQQLEKRGYSVADIDFTRTKKLSDIYISSQPIEISDGVFCEYWQLVSYGTFGTFQGVYPNPDGWPKPVSLSITFEPEEYKKLLKEAGNDSVESYIKDKLHTEIIE